MSDGFTNVRGLASINAWEQSHADAINRLRGCRAFVLVTVDDADDGTTFHALSRDLAAEGMHDLLVVAARASVEAAMEIDCEDQAA